MGRCKCSHAHVACYCSRFLDCCTLLSIIVRIFWSCFFCKWFSGNGNLPSRPYTICTNNNTPLMFAFFVRRFDMFPRAGSTGRVAFLFAYYRWCWSEVLLDLRFFRQGKSTVSIHTVIKKGHFLGNDVWLRTASWSWLLHHGCVKKKMNRTMVDVRSLPPTLMSSVIKRVPRSLPSVTNRKIRRGTNVHRVRFLLLASLVCHKTKQ